jgi:rubrerythrin
MMGLIEPERAFMQQAACPKCHRPLPEGAICCAEVRCMWRCRRCFKLTTGFAIPYGRCGLCDGELQMFTDSYPPELERLWAVREAVQAELEAYLFYKLARDQARHGEQRAVLERFCEAEMSVLNELEKQYHPHLAPRVLELELDEQNRLTQRLFRGICLSDHSAICDLYQAALMMERQSRDRFRMLAGQLPEGAERKVCAELAEKNEAHVALLEAELGLLVQAAT